MRLNSNIDTKIAVMFLLLCFVGTTSLILREYSLAVKELDILSESQLLANDLQETKLLNQRIVYIIDKGDNVLKEYYVVPEEDDTVFSLLEELAQRENFKLETKYYADMGVFVESIDGIKNGTDNKYWQYWVNGELPMVAADKKEMKKGDRVEWKFAQVSF